MNCSLIVSWNITFHEFMYKAQSALINLDYGIFFKASGHEEASELGWLLYSTYYQDEERLSKMISNLVQE